jgi:glycosyltransferase involved in cell wall biosynthesis
VDDGSTDATVQLLEAMRNSVPERIAVLRQQVNRGKAEAVRAGMLQALEQTRAETTGYWDADLATPLNAVPEMLAVLDARPAVRMVFGARVKLLGRRIERLAVRHYLGRIFATVVSNMLRLPVYDTQCGAKLFRRSDDLVAALQRPFLSRWVFDVEIIARFIQRLGVAEVERSIYELPLQEWADVGGSKVRPKDFVVAILDIAQIWRTYLSDVK